MGDETARLELRLSAIVGAKIPSSLTLGRAQVHKVFPNTVSPFSPLL